MIGYPKSDDDGVIIRTEFCKEHRCKPVLVASVPRSRRRGLLSFDILYNSFIGLVFSFVDALSLARGISFHASRTPSKPSNRTHMESIAISRSVGNVLISELKIARIDHNEKK